MLHHRYDDAEMVALWKKRAEKLRSLARATVDERARLELVELASQWDGLARQSELMLRRKLGLATIGAPPRPDGDGTARRNEAARGTGS